MNFLELAKRVRQEVGYSGDGPVSVAGQVGVLAKVVDWTRTAWREVQGQSVLWRFSWASFTTTLTAGKESYDLKGDWSLDARKLTHAPLYVYRTTETGARYFVPLIPWTDFRKLAPLAGEGFPVYCAQSPDSKLHLYPAPMAGLTAVLEYIRSPQELASNMDEPRMPAAYHMAIVWRAVMFACAHDENPPLFQSADMNYKSIMAQMMATEMDEIPMLEPLA